MEQTTLEERTSAHHSDDPTIARLTVSRDDRWHRQSTSKAHHIQRNMETWLCRRAAARGCIGMSTPRLVAETQPNAKKAKREF